MKIINFSLKIIIMPSLFAFLASCFHSPPEEPGKLVNPKLATLLNEAISRQISKMTAETTKAFLPQAQSSANEWLTQIQEVVARCRYGPSDKSKHNKIEYDITLNTGEQILNVYTGQRCLYGFEPPLIMRVRFRAGIVVEVLTDGRELKQSIDVIKGDIDLFAEKVTRSDWKRREHLYFRSAKTPEQIKEEWIKP